MFNPSSLALAKDIERRLNLKLEVEVAPFANFYLVNVFHKTQHRFIESGVAAGFECNPDTALLKALSEFVERRAMLSEKDPAIHRRHGSDGMAAYPVDLPNSHCIAERKRLSRSPRTPHVELLVGQSAN
ncbi:MAG: hypothetical protein HC883_06430 [Bdellovibrionaceae bacterium]|nr:hypothetical protein [Pseudobdellovibrionaceae bacterium]